MAARIAKEVSKCDKMFELKFVSEGNTSKLTAVIAGPPKSIWEGGRFKVSITMPADYPYSPPKIKFTSPMFHPNVYDKGTESVSELGIEAHGPGDICVDILENKTWTPGMTLESSLKSIQSMLDSPNIDSPANIDAAKLYRDDRETYNAMVASLIADQKGGRRKTRRGSHKRSRRTRR